MGRKKADLHDKDIFTTYDAARICSANIASIKNWIAKGLLKAFRTPGGHYRIKRRDLQLFIQKYNMPNPFQERLERKVYILDPDRGAIARLEKVLPDQILTTFDDALPAALKIGLERPDLLILGPDLGETRGEDFIDLLAGYPETKNITVVVFGAVEDTGRAAALRKRGVAELLGPELDSKDLRAALLEHLGA
ncbi:MAG: helix-turn-helix domain-containing protein [Deltaproteobacteria bacterium]|nr:helix-turn-helix domain-containing protein [Deltaproteobacteria bacterium]